MHRNSLLLLCALSGATSTSALTAHARIAPQEGSAQVKGILGRDNSEFARRLLEENLPEMAEHVCRTIETKGGSPIELLDAKAVQFELALLAARRLNDLDERKLALKKVLDDENAFIKENARTTVADTVRANLPAVYLELAATTIALSTREKDVEKRAAIIQEAQQIFAEAKTALEERVKRYKDQIDQGVNVDTAQRQHLMASFSLARMNYQNAQLYAEGSPERKELLETALQGFQDIGLDYDDKYENYQGMIYQGLCHDALGLTDDALVDYEDAVVRLRELFVVEKGVYQVDVQSCDIISGATLQRVKLLTRLKRTREAIAAAEEFLQTIPDPLLASSGVDVLENKARAEIAGGDIAGASATAEALIAFDHQGAAGRIGRSLLAELPVVGLSPDKILKIAETAFNRGDYGRALDLCRQAREAVRGARDEHEIGAAAFTLTGRIYYLQGRWYEASMAYDLAAELYPNGSKAPEALNAAVNVYRQLATRDRSRFYSKRADERMNALATKYSKHPLAANASIYQGLKSEDEGDFAAAIAFYSKIPESSPSYQEANFRLANATYQSAKVLLQQGKKAEAEPLLKQAEQQYQTAITIITKAQEATLDSAVQQKLGNYLVSSKLGLGALLIDLKKSSQVKPLIEGLDEKVASDPDMVAAVWSLRIRALQAEGKVDEAVTLFEALLQRTPDAPGIASAAGVLARALDQAALTLHEKDPKSKRVEELWQRAGFYYSKSVEPALAGATALRADDVSEVALRLYIIGLFFNHVPEGQLTFVDWQGEVVDDAPWKRAAEIYERLDAQAPSTRISIERARTLAILGKIPEAEVIYSALFDQISLFKPDTQVFDTEVIEARPELLSAYLEWGVTEHLVGLDKNDQGRLDRAGDIYARMFKNTTPDQRLWWQAKFSQVKLLMDRGSYEDADLAVRSVKRTTDPEFDKGKFGFKDKFLAMESELSKKVFKPNTPPPKKP